MVHRAFHAHAELDASHDPGLRCCVLSAEEPLTDFPIQNLPHGVFRRRAAVAEPGEPWRGGVAVGNQILDLQAVLAHGVWADDAELLAVARAAATAPLNALMAMGPVAWRRLRLALSALLRAESCWASQVPAWLVPQADAEMDLPARVGGYTSFVTAPEAVWHFLATQALPSSAVSALGWRPVASPGRASALVPAGGSFPRPKGPLPTADGQGMRLAPSQQVDFGLAVGGFIGPGTARGQSIKAAQAGDQLFGLCLLNEWAARDVQAWEAPLAGPFLARSFLTSVSPWIVTMAALAPFRCDLPRAHNGLALAPHLREPHPLAGYDLTLDVWLQTANSDAPAEMLSRVGYRQSGWTLTQLVAHHTESGCSLRPGDLLSTGTQSGPGRGEPGCLQRLTRCGRMPITLKHGERRTFLEDGDTVILRGSAQRYRHRRIGFGACLGTLQAASGPRPEDCA